MLLLLLWYQQVPTYTVGCVPGTSTRRCHACNIWLQLYLKVKHNELQNVPQRDSRERAAESRRQTAGGRQQLATQYLGTLALTYSSNIVVLTEIGTRYISYWSFNVSARIVIVWYVRIVRSYSTNQYLLPYIF